MNKAEKDTIKAHLNAEQKALQELEKAYKQAKKDCQERIKALNARTDMQNLQTIVHQRKYQQVLLKQIDGVLNDLQTHTYQSANEFFQSAYENGYIGSMYELINQDIPLTIPISRKKMLTAIQTDSKISKDYYLKQGLTVQNIRTLKQQIAQEATRGIASGKSWLEVANSLSIQRYFSISLSDAMRICRTEGNRINQQARLDAGDEAVKAGCDLLKQWDATMDDKTRPWHREADGQIVEWDESFTVMGEKLKAPSIGGSAKNVINCRCQLLKRPRWALDEEELERLKKRAEYFGLDKSQSFEEYKQKFLSLQSVPKQEEIIEKVVETSFEDKMKVIQDRIKDQGYATEDDLHEAGLLVKGELGIDAQIADAQLRYDELTQQKIKLNDQISDINNQIDKLTDGYYYNPIAQFRGKGSGYLGLPEDVEKQVLDLQKKIKDIKNGDEWSMLVLKMDECMDEITFEGERSAKNLFSVLSRIREMGHPDATKAIKKTRATTRKPLLGAFEYYPKSWIQKTIDDAVAHKHLIETWKENRGYHLGSLIVLSGSDYAEMFETAIHEWGHHFESLITCGPSAQLYKDKKFNVVGDTSSKFICQAEKIFYDRRTAGEKSTWLGSPYGRSEIAKRDNFIDAYMGKDYGDQPDFELVSMGFQYAYCSPLKLEKDPDMESWIYGILALYE